MADRYEIREELDRHRYNQIADAKNQAWWEAERQRPFWTPGTIGAMAGLAVLFGTLLYLFVVLLVLGSVLLEWPDLLWDLAMAYTAGLPNLTVLLMTAQAAALVGMFVHDLRETRTTGRAPWKRYLVLAAAITAVFYLGIDLIWDDASLSGVLDNAFYGLRLGALPALILYYVEFKTKGWKNFHIFLVLRVNRVVPGGSKLILVMGILSILLALLLVLGSVLTGMPCDLDLIVVPIAVGILSLYVALKGGL